MSYDYAAAQQLPTEKALEEMLDNLSFHTPFDPETQRAVMEAMKEELSKVKDALHTAMSASGAEALEARYLAQIKKNKNLTVQLAAERTRVIQMEKAMMEAQQRTKEVLMEHERLMKRKRNHKSGPLCHEDEGEKEARPTVEFKDIVMDVATRAAKERLGYDATTVASEQKRQSKARDTTEEDEEEDPDEIIRSLKERLDRSFKIIAERDTHINEVKREVQLWRKVVQKETGATKEEVERILRDAISHSGGKGRSASTSAPKAAEGDEEGVSAPAELSLAKKDGWRGRAQTIILLKGKLKDTEDELRQARQRETALVEALAANRPPEGSAGVSPRTVAASSRWTDDGAGGDDLESLMALARRNPPTASQQSTAKPPIASTVGGDRASVAPSVKDVDEEARQHLSQLGNKRLQQQREMEREVQAQQDRLLEEQRRHTALQARLTAVQRECQQLRQHVDTILQKSAADDELIEAYREERLALQDALREERMQRGAQQRAEEVQDEADQARPTNASGDAVLDRKRKAILAAERQRQMDQQPRRDEHTVSAMETGAMANGKEVALQDPSEVMDPEERDRVHRQSFYAHLQQRLLQLQGGEKSVVVGGPKAVLEHVLSDFERITESCFAYVKALQTSQGQHDGEASRLYRLYSELWTAVQELGKPGSRVHQKALEAPLKQLAAFPPLEKFLVQENKQLKERLHTIADLLETAEAARKVWTEKAAMAASPDRTAAAAAPPSDLVSKYDKLQKDYGDLRREFNRIQMKGMNQDPIPR